MNSLEPRLLHDFEHDVARYYNREGKIGLEEILDKLSACHFAISNGCETGPELRDQNESIENETRPRSPHCCLRTEGEFIKRVASILPRLPKTNVAKTNGPPVKDGR